MSLIINADDLGYSEHRDHGIFDCFQNGSISAASLIVNGPTSKSAAEKAKSLGLYIGLHLNLTEGLALTGVSSITNEQGQMYYKQNFMRLINSGVEPFQTAIIEETRAQFEKFKELSGEYPKHVDGHQHVHIFLGMPDILAPLFKEYGVLSTRIPDEDISACDWLSPEVKLRYQQRFIACIRARLVYKIHDIKAPECFVGLTLCGTNLTSERYLKSIENVFGIVEYMVHPGFIGTPKGLFSDTFDSDKGRLNELNCLRKIKKVLPLVDWSVYSK